MAERKILISVEDYEKLRHSYMNINKDITDNESLGNKSVCNHPQSPLIEKHHPAAESKSGTLLEYKSSTLETRRSQAATNKNKNTAAAAQKKKHPTTTEKKLTPPVARQQKTSDEKTAKPLLAPPSFSSTQLKFEKKSKSNFKLPTSWTSLW